MSAGPIAEYALLDQKAPTDTAETLLFECPAGAAAIGSTLVLSNITALTGSAVDVFVTVRVRKAGASASNAEIVVPGSLLAPRTAVPLTIGITLSAGQAVFVQSSVANGLAANLFGTVIS